MPCVRSRLVSLLHHNTPDGFVVIKLCNNYIHTIEKMLFVIVDLALCDLEQTLVTEDRLAMPEELRFLSSLIRLYCFVVLETLRCLLQRCGAVEEGFV